jgi:hypothetical protein
LAAESAISSFGTAPTVAEQADALSALIKLKKIHAAAKEPAFDAGIQRLISAAKKSDDVSTRSLAIANLLRIAVLVRRQQEPITRALCADLNDPLPPLVKVPDPNDRYYLACLWRYAKPTWLTEFLAAASVLEENSEKVRAECVEGLFSLKPTVSEVLETISPVLRAWHPETEKPGNTKGRRLKRILEAVRNVLSASSKDPGQTAGLAARELLRSAFNKLDRPESPLVRDEITEQFSALLHEIVKARFSLATNPKTFVGVSLIREWFHQRDWEDYASTSRSVALIRDDIAEAMRTLVGAGKADAELYTLLVLTAGSSDKARQIAKEILAEHPGLPEEISAWLSGTPPRRRSALAAESQAISIEGILADVLADSEKLNELAARVQRELLPQIAVLLPQSSPLIDHLIGLVRATNTQVRTALESRSISLLGEVGRAVEYSPLQHQPSVELPPGTRMVSIVRPAVVVQDQGGVQRVIRKALVEPIHTEG